METTEEYFERKYGRAMFSNTNWNLQDIWEFGDQYAKKQNQIYHDKVYELTEVNDKQSERIIQLEKHIYNMTNCICSTPQDQMNGTGLCVYCSKTIGISLKPAL